jgi:hypothetical protein
MSLPEALVAAVSARGTILAVSELIGVAPQTIYRWIAGVDLPDEEEQARLIALLSTII